MESSLHLCNKNCVDKYQRQTEPSVPEERELGNLGKSCSNFNSIICSAYIWTSPGCHLVLVSHLSTILQMQSTGATYNLANTSKTGGSGGQINFYACRYLIYDDQHALVRLIVGRLIKFLFLQSPYWMKHGWLRLDYVQLQQDINMRSVWYETFR